MCTITSRRAAALLAVAGALLFAAFTAVSAAQAATIYACVKKSGSIRVVTKKAKCKRGESKLSWNTAGPAGKNGANGGNGANGANGANGKDLISQTPLASGQSESGFFAAADGESKSGYVAQGISFSQPLAAPIAENHVLYNLEKVTSAQCPGFGQAAPGYVCLYESEGSGLLPFFIARDFALHANAADKYGFALFFEAKAAGTFVAGSWTVTAP